MIQIRYAEASDREFWYQLDRHLPEGEFENKVRRKQGYGMLLTSTQTDETAQHFYRKIGYKDCGALIMTIPGYEQPMEMFLAKAVK